MRVRCRMGVLPSFSSVRIHHGVLEWASPTTEERFQWSVVSETPIRLAPTGPHPIAQGRDALVASPGSRCHSGSQP